MDPNTFILFAEDDEAEAVLLRAACRRIGLAPEQYYLARDGFQAITYLESAEAKAVIRPTHVVTDLDMPLFNGFKLLRWIRGHSRFHDLPVTILTKLVTPELEDLALSEGCARIAKKPMNIHELSEIIMECAR